MANVLYKSFTASKDGKDYEVKVTKYPQRYHLRFVVSTEDIEYRAFLVEESEEVVKSKIGTFFRMNQFIPKKVQETAWRRVPT